MLDSTEDGSLELQETLVTLGYDCELALSGPEARLLCESSHPDIIVLEWKCEKHQEELLAARLTTSSRSQIVAWMNKPVVAQIIRLINEFHVCAFFSGRPELRDLLVVAERVENRSKHEHERENQHSRLTLEYARLKRAYDELRDPR